ncbi:sensor histidine kinase [Microbacterium sp. GXF6406]
MTAQTRRTLITTAVIAAPLVLGAVVSGILLLLGERRSLIVSMTIPAVIAVAGLIVSAVVGVIALIRSRRRRTQHRVQAAEPQGRESGAALERESHRRFLARLDHELKNPLTAILATAAGREDADWITVDAQARKLSGLVRDLRKLAELETIPIERESVDLELLVQEAIDAVRHRDPAAGARIQLSATRVPWPIPPVQADMDLISLAIDNVLGNAVKYSVDGPIEVRLREEDGDAILEFADTGRGIPSVDLPHVFDELARASNARDVTGSGLGLTLVSTVVSRHGGAVSMRSAEGSGSVVVLRLPVT